MYQLEPHLIHCPYCGERLEVLIDPSVVEQDYIEDCQVCCRPINFFVSLDEEGVVDVRVGHENE